MTDQTKQNLETISVTRLETRFGPAVAAAGEAGLCLLLLGEDETAALAELRRSRPGAAFEAGDDERTAKLALAALEGLPVETDPRGTAFQLAVWEALRAIPAGATASYADVARTVGRPKAVRAVAAACAANRIAVAIPCHRVVRSDGGLSGYRWGAGLKKAILASESLQQRDTEDTCRIHVPALS